MTDHVKYICPGNHDRHCQFCDGGLSGCVVCGAFEGAWPDDCPGEQMTADQSDAVYAGLLNYRDGAWRDECCEIRLPVDERMAKRGYVHVETSVDGRWAKTTAPEAQPGWST